MTDKCVICLDNINLKDDVNILTLECSHTYHKECIDKWLNRAQTCPICREKVEPENTIRDLAIHRYIHNLKLVQLVALTDIVTSSATIMMTNGGMIDFVCALWGYWGSYKLNINYLILYGISRICTVGIIVYNTVIYVKNDIQRLYNIMIFMYCVMSVFYLYVGYIIMILSRDMYKYKEEVLLLVTN